MKVKLGAKGLSKALNPNYNNGDKFKIKTYARGQFLGEEDVIRGRNHTATVICKSEGILLQITIDVFIYIYIYIGFFSMGLANPVCKELF